MPAENQTHLMHLNYYSSSFLLFFSIFLTLTLSQNSRFCSYFVSGRAINDKRGGHHCSELEVATQKGQLQPREVFPGQNMSSAIPPGSQAGLMGTPCRQWVGMTHAGLCWVKVVNNFPQASAASRPRTAATAGSQHTFMQPEPSVLLQGEAYSLTPRGKVDRVSQMISPGNMHKLSTNENRENAV